MDAAAARKGWEDRIAKPVSLVTGTLDKMAANVRLSVCKSHSPNTYVGVCSVCVTACHVWTREAMMTSGDTPLLVTTKSATPPQECTRTKFNICVIVCYMYAREAVVISDKQTNFISTITTL